MRSLKIFGVLVVVVLVAGLISGRLQREAASVDTPAPPEAATAAAEPQEDPEHDADEQRRVADARLAEMLEPFATLIEERVGLAADQVFCLRNQCSGDIGPVFLRMRAPATGLLWIDAALGGLDNAETFLRLCAGAVSYVTTASQLESEAFVANAVEALTDEGHVSADVANASFSIRVSERGLPGCLVIGNVGEKIAQDEFGDAWPFTVPEGRLRCERPSQVVFRAGGVDYAVNGMASGSYAAIEPIWRLNEKLATKDAPVRVNIGPIINSGLRMCPE